MKRFLSIILVVLISCFILQGCGANKPATKSSDISKVDTQESKITEKMAYEGINNYCHSEFDWSVAEENPSIMYVSMGDETETEYKVIFRSYTGSFIYFYVNKDTGTTKMTEYVPTLDIENDLGNIELSDYLK